MFTNMVLDRDYTRTEGRDLITINARGGNDFQGEVANAIGDVGFNPELSRPFIDDNGRKAIIVNTGRVTTDPKTGRRKKHYRKMYREDLEKEGIDPSIVRNATLRKDTWIQMRTRALREARKRLRAWADLAAANPNRLDDGMGTLTYEYEAQNDPGEAIVDMDFDTDGRNDAPQTNLRSIPLPVTFVKYSFSRRRLAASKRGGQQGVNMSMAEASGRRVAEVLEQTTIGTMTGTSFGPTSASDSRYTGNSTVYGYTNLPTKIAKTDLTTPTGSNPEAVKQDVIEMRELMTANNFFGPYFLYYSTGYDAYLDDDYFRAGSTSQSTTLRNRILQIGDVTSIRRLDYLTSGYQMIMVDPDPEFAEALIGSDIETIQYETQGGARVHFVTYIIAAPLLKTNYGGVARVVHATTS